MGNFAQLLLVLAVSFGFGAWPTVANKANHDSGWYGMITTFVPVLMLGVWRFRSLGNVPDGPAQKFLIGAGIINGVGFLAYITIVSTPSLKHLAPAGMIGTIAVLSLLAAHTSGNVIFTPTRVAALITGTISVYLFFKAG